MNRKIQMFMKNLGHLLTSNLVTLSISILVTLVVPKIVGVEQYGYFQLYLFYASYLGFLQFGWNDGLYLKIGGSDYSQLNKISMFSQFWTLVLSQVIIGLFLISFSKVSDMGVNKSFIFLILGLTVIAIGTRAMLLFVFQATNRFVEFSRAMIIDRVIYLFLIILFLSVGIDNFQYIIIADLVGKGLTLGYVMYLAKDIVFMSPLHYRFEGQEIYDNVRIGSSLMFANIAGMLILGIVRFGIEQVWDVKTFGKVSLILSISMMVMVFINAISNALFPVLRRTSRESLAPLYVMLRDLLMPLLMSMLIIYFPLKILLIRWLPDYLDSINYMFLIFPIIVYEGKMSLLVNTYLKTIRREKLMMRVNLIGVIISIILTAFSAFYLKNLYLTMFSILLVLAIRCLLAEMLLSSVLKISVLKDIIVEVLLTGIFILLVWFAPSEMAFFGYVGFYTLYLLKKKKNLLRAKQTFKNLISKRSEIRE